MGAGPVAADLVAAYTRGTPAPADPAQLLVRPVAGTAVPAASPTMMPDRAVVCRCNGVTKGDIVGCWRHGARTVDDVAAADPRDHRLRRLQGRRLRHRRLAPPLRPGPAALPRAPRRDTRAHDPGARSDRSLDAVETQHVAVAL